MENQCHEHMLRFALKKKKTHYVAISTRVIDIKVCNLLKHTLITSCRLQITSKQIYLTQLKQPHQCPCLQDHLQSSEDWCEILELLLELENLLKQSENNQGMKFILKVLYIQNYWDWFVCCISNIKTNTNTLNPLTLSYTEHYYYFTSLVVTAFYIVWNIL